jgi:hypothetical protein
MEQYIAKQTKLRIQPKILTTLQQLKKQNTEDLCLANTGFCSQVKFWWMQNLSN